jgi:hypothetical protein
MKRLIACFLLSAGLLSSSFLHAGPVAPQLSPGSTPTTKILAIGTINAGVHLAQVNAVLPNEVRDTVNLYLEGKIDQWYSLEGERHGVAFILNMSDLNAARDMLERLPLGQAHMMKFELIPIGPLNPLRRFGEKVDRP